VWGGWGGRGLGDLQESCISEGVFVCVGGVEAGG